MPNTLIIRADASSRIGTGHVMRCLALAQRWQHNGGRVVFAQAETTPALEQRLKTAAIEIVPITALLGSVEDGDQTSDSARQFGAQWIVADGYAFGASWQKHIKDAGFRLLVLDDYGHAEHYHADIVLNQNASAHEQLYACRDASTRLLLGTRYALLRPEFSIWRDWKREIPKRATKVLVSLGGSDPDNTTSVVVKTLAQLSNIQSVIVAGGSNPHLPALEEFVASHTPSMRLETNVANMPELMAWADIAISAAGSTSWELAYMGLPSALIVTGSNQEGIADKLGREKISINLGNHHHLSGEKIIGVVASLLTGAAQRHDMSERARLLVDHRGANRVVSYLTAAHLNLRSADKADAQLLWLWSNDPDTRASSFNQDPIPWERHVTWFGDKIQSYSSVIYVAFLFLDKPIGQARFDWDETGVAEIAISVDQRLRNGGIGSALLRRAVDEAFATKPIRSVNAFIKPDNLASIGAFENADFRIIGTTVWRGHPAVHMSASRV
jgi:UDP-2,4-diacetamido-2,4,6-trideoxy-beta-L-altropyranose hydrolase